MNNKYTKLPNIERSNTTQIFKSNKESDDLLDDIEEYKKSEKNTKNIKLPCIDESIISQSCKKINSEKEKKSRIITEEDFWVLKIEDYNSNNQYEIIFEEKQDDKKITIREKTYNYCDYIRKLSKQQIYKKIHSYRSQDIEKNIWNPTEFIEYDDVMNLLCESKLVCFYCKEKILILYKFVREPKQWSLDRIDNDFGHNKNNVVIACLSCNLRRKCIYHDKYVFTKQIGTIKKLDT